MKLVKLTTIITRLCIVYFLHNVFCRMFYFILNDNLYKSYTSNLHICYGFHMDTMFDSSLPSAVCRRDHVLFTLFVFVCMWWCPARVVLCLCSVFLCLVYPVLPVYLDCPFLFSPSVFSDVYFYFIFWLVIQSTKFTMATLFVCGLKINILCPSYIEKALLHLNGQMGWHIHSC